MAARTRTRPPLQTAPNRPGPRQPVALLDVVRSQSQACHGAASRGSIRAHILPTSTRYHRVSGGNPGYEFPLLTALFDSVIRAVRRTTTYSPAITPNPA